MSKSPKRPATKKPARGLGRGLEGLLQEPVQLATLTKPAPSQTVSWLGIDEIQASKLQPRQHFDQTALKELGDSITRQGVLQPLLVRPLADSTGARYELVAGERRWRAAQLAGVHRVPVVVRKLANKDVLEIALIENIQRRDLNPIEEAQAYDRLIKEFGYTQEQLGDRLGKSRVYIANSLRLRQLPEQVQHLVLQSKLSAGAARALIGHPEAIRLAKQALSQRLNVRQIEALAARKPRHESARRGPSADIRALERSLSKTLGLVVRVRPRSKQAGLVQLAYTSLEQLDSLLLRLRSRPPRR